VGVPRRAVASPFFFAAQHLLQYAMVIKNNEH
jgi:hypothetical protein